jgi:periplasmic protein TonB
MEAGSASEAVNFNWLIQPDARIALRRDEENGWLLAVATLAAIALHALMIVGALEHWPDRSSPIEPEIFAELIVEPPVPAAEAEPQPELEAAAPATEEFRQSGGDPDLAPGGATPEPDVQASTPPEPVRDAAEGPPLAPAQQQSPERAAARSEVLGHDDGKGGGDRYLNEIRDIVLKQRNYPLQLSGTAFYELLIDRAGSLLGAKLVRTSGIGVVDDVGMGMIRRAAPFPPVPDYMGGERIVVSLRLYLGPQGGR